MSQESIIVLIYHRHKLFDLIRVDWLTIFKTMLWSIVIVMYFPWSSKWSLCFRLSPGTLYIFINVYTVPCGLGDRYARVYTRYLREHRRSYECRIIWRPFSRLPTAFHICCCVSQGRKKGAELWKQPSLCSASPSMISNNLACPCALSAGLIKLNA
jgi:hypothetical protein